MPITVLLVDDHAGLRRALRSLIEQIPILRVVAEATDGEAAVRLARKLLPDLVLMDVEMPGISGIEAARLIVSTTSCRVIMLSMLNERHVVVESLRVGALGYVHKERAARELLPAIRQVMAGERFLSVTCGDGRDLGATWVEPVDVSPGKMSRGLIQAQEIATPAARDEDGQGPGSP